MRRVGSLEKPDAGRDWGQEEKGTTEDEMARWHHRLDGHEFEWTQGVGDGQGGLVCCNSWGRKESDMTQRLNWTELFFNIVVPFAIHWHESATGVHVFPILNPLPCPYPFHPSGLSQSTGFECLVTWIELGLVIYFTYGNVHVSMLFSQIIPPSPSPAYSESLFFIFVSLAVLHIGSLLPSF